MFRDCGEKHLPGMCDAFKKLSPQQRLKEIDGCELCWLCYRHLQGRECWSQGKVPNCGVDRLRGTSSSPSARRTRGRPLYR